MHLKNTIHRIVAGLCSLIALALLGVAVSAFAIGGPPVRSTAAAPAGQVVAATTGAAKGAAPGAPFAREVGAKLVTLNKALQDALSTSNRLKDDPALLYSKDWENEWLGAAWEAQVAAEAVRTLPAPADSADLKSAAVGAADNAVEMLRHMARNIDAIKAGDDATAQRELSSWRSAFDAYEQQILKVSRLAP